MGHSWCTEWEREVTCMKTFFIMLCKVLRRAGSYSRADGDLNHLGQTDTEIDRQTDRQTLI